MATNLFSLSGASFGEVTRRVWKEIGDDDVFGRAAQLAYYFFLALFPFLICVIAGLSVFGYADRGRALLFQAFGSTIPASAADLINRTITGIIQASGPLKMSVGIIAALWSAAAGTHAIMDTLNAAYNVRETRSFVKQYAVAVALTVGIAILLMISLLVIVFGNDVIESFSLGAVVSALWRAAQWPFALALVLFAFAITYYFAPDLKTREWHWVSPGALMGVILWVAVSLGLRVYLHFFNSYSGTYGSLGAVIILLLWFYLTGIAILAGACLNGVLELLAVSVVERRNPAVKFQRSPAA